MRHSIRLYSHPDIVSEVAHRFKFMAALLVFVLALFSFPGEAFGVGQVGIDPGIRDTVSIEAVEGLRGGSIVVPVNMFADETLGGVTLVFNYDPVALNLDSLSFAGTRGEPLSSRFVNIDSSLGTVNAAAFSFTNVITPGSGVIVNMHFTIADSAVAGIYTVDTTTIVPQGGPGILQTSFSSVQTDTIGAATIFPEFIAGAITIVERAATFDSIWVDTVTAIQGETITVDVFLHNELSLTVIKIPLHYASSKLIFDTVLFAGTRGILAGQLRQSQNNTDSQAVLITLEYLDSSPLTPGDGPIARLRFTVDNTTPIGTISIDTSAFLGFVPLELITTVADGSFRFTPIFHAGAIVVDIQTGVDDDEQSTLPTEFRLEQNYPNPFNPTTKIPFALPKGSDVTLEVFNILGQRVRTLCDGYRSPGEHVIEFDGLNDNGTSIASGLYFYRLNAGDVTTTRKMTLLK